MNFQKIHELFKDANAKAFFAALLLIVSTWIASCFSFNAKVTCFDVVTGYIPIIIFFMIINYHKYSFAYSDNNGN
jgi:hypothetical protein